MMNSGCSWISSVTAPKEIVELTTQATIISEQAMTRPLTLEQIKAYLEINHSAWMEIARFYGVINE